MVAVNPRVRCLQEPVWSWGHQGQGGMRSGWREKSPHNQFRHYTNGHIDIHFSIEQLYLQPLPLTLSTLKVTQTKNTCVFPPLNLHFHCLSYF